MKRVNEFYRIIYHSGKLKLLKRERGKPSMKFKGILCTGHPRSGTHYIAALVSVNFLNDEDYLKIYRNHELPHMVQDPHMAYIYVWRRFEGVARSIYVLKERFGLKVDSYETFIAKRYSEMWGAGNPDQVVTKIRTLHEKASLSGISDFFQKVDMTPKAYWAYYNRKWAECADTHTNVFGICYDDMVQDFKGSMGDMALKLGSSLSEFKDIRQKIGWWK